jgi:hypothetical protein
MMNETISKRTITAEEAAEALRGSIQMDYGMNEAFRKLHDRTAKALNDYHKVVEESERNTLILQSISALFTLIATIIIYKRYDWSGHKKITNILMTGANDSKHFKMVAIATNIWNAVVVTAQAIKYIRALRG